MCKKDSSLSGKITFLTDCHMCVIGEGTVKEALSNGWWLVNWDDGTTWDYRYGPYTGFSGCLRPAYCTGKTFATYIFSTM